jgi:DNA-binding response OmpR family regulator
MHKSSETFPDCYKAFLISKSSTELLSSSIDFVIVPKMRQMKKILFVAFDHEFSATLRSYFEDQYQILIAQNYKAALTILETMTPDILVSPLEIPKWAQPIRQHTNAGIIFVVINEGPDTERKVFEAGGDYYVVQPISLESLKWKIKAMLRKNNLLTNSTIFIGQITLDVTNRLVIINKKSRTLTPLQFDLLVAFAEHPDRLLSRTWLRQNVWKGQQVSERTIDAHISKLKKQLPELNDLLMNVYGEGYRLIAKPNAA